MKNIVQELIERIQGLQAEQEDLERRREDLERRREELDQQIKEKAELLKSLRHVLRFESENTGTDLPDAGMGIVANVGRWSNVSLTDAIGQLVADIPRWEMLPRREQYDSILARLREEHYPFNGKRADLAVNVGLTKFLQKHHGGTMSPKTE